MIKRGDDVMACFSNGTYEIIKKITAHYPFPYTPDGAQQAIACITELIKKDR